MSQFKDLRKAAFAVAFGATMGKFAAEMTKAAISGVGIGTLKFAAKEGSESLRKHARNLGIKIEPEKKEESESNKIIGFHG